MDIAWFPIFYRNVKLVGMVYYPLTGGVIFKINHCEFHGFNYIVTGYMKDGAPDDLLEYYGEISSVFGYAAYATTSPIAPLFVLVTNIHFKRPYRPLSYPDPLTDTTLHRTGNSPTGVENKSPSIYRII
jgi:hypothetical protein